MLSKDIIKITKDHPRKFLAIFLGCLHKPTSLTEIAERFGFARRSLYQHNLAKKMVDLGVLYIVPTKNKKIKLYISQMAWLWEIIKEKP